MSFTGGLVVALALLAAGGLVAARYIMAQIAVNPPRPTFPNEAGAPPIAAAPGRGPAAPIPGGVVLPVVAPAPAPKPAAPPAAPQPAAAPVAVPAASTPPLEFPAELAPVPLPAGAYRARVTQPIGLVLRSSPGRGGDRLGSIDYNALAIVIEQSPDKRWQKIRVGENGPEGWVRAGNTRKVEEPVN